MSLNLKGYVFSAYQYNNQPVLGSIGDMDCLAIFSTIEKLRAYLPILNPPFLTKVKQILDGKEFLDSIHEGGVRVIIDPYIVNGNTRFTLIQQQLD